LFGLGLVEPADDIRDTNPASHPELLEALAQDFVNSNYDLRRSLRRMVLSAAYSRSSQTDSINQADDRFYSHALRRTLEPEVLADAIFDVTGVADQYGDQPKGLRAIELVDVLTPSDSLDILGRCSRRESCEGVTAAGALKTKLHQINGDLINKKVMDRRGFLHREIDANANNQQIIDAIYSRALSRRPTPTERIHWEKQLESAGAEGRSKMLEDILWGVLNCSEFMLNH
jgi:hypothetical protein